MLVNQDEVSELESENRILRPQDEREREMNRIKPNPTLAIQPIFMDPGPSTKPVKGKQRDKGLPNGLCLEVTGRVQHDSNQLKYFMIDTWPLVINTAENGLYSSGPLVNIDMLMESEKESSLDGHWGQVFVFFLKQNWVKCSGVVSLYKYHLFAEGFATLFSQLVIRLDEGVGGNCKMKVVFAIVEKAVTLTPVSYANKIIRFQFLFF